MAGGRKISLVVDVVAYNQGKAAEAVRRAIKDVETEVERSNAKIVADEKRKAKEIEKENARLAREKAKQDKEAAKESEKEAAKVAKQAKERERAKAQEAKQTSDLIKRIEQETTRQAKAQLKLREKAEKDLTAVKNREAKAQADAFSRSLSKMRSESKQSTDILGDAFSGGILGGLIGGGVAGGLAAGISAGFSTLQSLLSSLTSTVYDLGKASLDAGMRFEATVNAMTAITGSSNQAKTELKSLIDLTRNSPGLRLETAEQGYKRLRAIGFEAERTKRIIKELSEEKILSGVGEDAVNAILFNFTQIATGGQKIGQEIREIIGQMPSLKNAFMDAFGTLSGDALQTQLEALGSDAFFDKLLTSLEKTKSATGGLEDAYSKLIDELIIAGREMSSPVIPELTQDIRQLTQYLRENEQGWKFWGYVVRDTFKFAEGSIKAFGETAKNVFLNVSGFVEGATFGFVNFAQTISSYEQSVITRIKNQERNANYQEFMTNIGMNSGSMTVGNGAINPNSMTVNSGAFFKPSISPMPMIETEVGKSKTPKPKKFELSSKAKSIIDAANKLGVSPLDLATIISYETRGTFNPNEVGGKNDNYQGLIQFGIPERKQFGVYKGQSFEEQMNSVVKYFEFRFNQAGRTTQGATILDLYKTVNGGNPNVSASKSDGHGTIGQHVQRMMGGHRKKALNFLFGGNMKNLPEGLRFENAEQQERQIIDNLNKAFADRENAFMMDFYKKFPFMLTDKALENLAEFKNKDIKLEQDKVTSLDMKKLFPSQPLSPIETETFVADGGSTFADRLTERTARLIDLGEEYTNLLYELSREQDKYEYQEIQLLEEKIGLKTEILNLENQIANLGSTTDEKRQKAYLSEVYNIKQQREELEIQLEIQKSIYNNPKFQEYIYDNYRLTQELQKQTDLQEMKMRLEYDFANKGVFNAQESDLRVLDAINQRVKSVTDTVTDFRISMADNFFKAIESPFDSLNKKLEKLPPIIKDIAKSFSDLGRDIIKLLTHNVVLKALGLSGGGGSSGGGGFFGNIFSSILGNRQATGGFAGGPGAGGLLNSTGGNFGGSLIGKLLGFGGRAVGTSANAATNISMGIPLSTTASVADFSGNIVGSLSSGGAGAVGGAAGAGSLGSLTAFFTNPWTIGIGAAALGSFILWRMLKGDPSIKRLKEAGQTEYGIKIEDKNLLKRVKLIGETFLGKNVADKLEGAKQVIKLEENRDILLEYAKRTGQNTAKIEKEQFGDVNYVGNKFDFSSGNPKFGGMREHGGTVRRGYAYLVGEKRPELFVPKTDGTILPNTNALSSSDSAVTALTAMIAYLGEVIADFNEKISVADSGDIFVKNLQNNKDKVAETVNDAHSANAGLKEAFDRNTGIIY